MQNCNEVNFALAWLNHVVGQCLKHKTEWYSDRDETRKLQSALTQKILILGLSCTAAATRKFPHRGTNK